MVVSGAACSSSSSGGGDTVTLLTHDSFALPDSVRAEFTKQTGLTIKVVSSGDAGQVASTVALTPGRPKADAVYGIDNTFASRVISAKALDGYASPALTGSARDYKLPGGADLLTPVDRGDVCVNVDNAWYAARNQQPPTSIADLTDPRFAGQLVAMDPSTSSPGLGFLLATIAAYPSDWQSYWTKLRANGVKIVSGWEEGYNQQFSGGQGKGPSPIVVSYASSPAANPATKALLDSCFRQVEYIGVLKGAAHPDRARKLIDFMLGPQVQQALPDAMYVYPVRDGVALPAAWQKSAPLPDSTVELAPNAIAANRENWQKQWRSIMGR
ncbi:thiamine ABC transporter substrate-binding protein [Williamsia sp. CHRR-6]|nr:thiamine ABC transporter substrate-binding protein [Williamsia sp. CHRR-6]